MSGSDDRLAWRTFNLNWIPIAALGAALLIGIARTNFSLEPVAFGVTSAVAFSLALIAYVHAFSKAEAADPKLVYWVGTTAQVILVTAIVGPLSYLANAAGWPLQDQALLSIDRAIGMDPESIAAFVNNHQWLAKCFDTGYGFIKWPLLGVPIILAMKLRFIRLQQFILALNIALIVTIVISVFVPAIGTYYGLNVSPERFPLLNGSIYASQLRDILSLRDGSLRQIELFKLSGIVSFPSFHAASAVLYAWALWPVRGFIRYAASGINGLMLASTPVIGAHYMIDVIAGVLLAALAILLAKYFFRILASGNTAGARANSTAETIPQLALGQS